MKAIRLAFIVASTIILAVAGTVFAENTKGVQKQPVSAPKHLNVLAIGNSFSISLQRYFVQVVESVPGCTIDFDHLTIGGCSLERHWNNIDKESKEPDFKYFKKYTYAEKLKSKKWDVVSIQQVSHMSWQKETFFPYARNLYRFIHENAPQAEIVLQQTWSYRPDAPRLAQWSFDQNEMYDRLAASIGYAAGELNVRQIPTGLALQIARKTQAGGYDHPSCLPSNYVYPNVADTSRHFIGGKPVWKNGKYVTGDTIHLNARGQYLQACVWFAALYGRSAKEITYIPKELTAGDAEFLRNVAQQAVTQFKQVNH
ncbi:MAG: DUF4886 domain-containing protein [Thermoguttaceae bacterium]|nr:DUF4886 domain-containing protein [Thermoguttaceae bacterium]